MKLRILSAADVERALPMPAAIAAMRAAFAALSAGAVAAPPRARIAEPDRTTLLMAAGGTAGRIAKIVSIFPRNVERGLPTVLGHLLVIDPETGAVVGLCEGAALTAVRTGAASGLATDLLARADAEVLAVIGAGEQARTQILGVAAVRELREVRVYAPRRERRAEFAARLATEIGTDVRAVDSSAAAVDGADIVCTATGSVDPVLDGDRLQAGAHVNGVGSFRLDMRELDERTLVRAARIVVDSRESARDEAGELVAAAAAGLVDPKRWLELGELVAEPARGRATADEITVFKSVGHAAQDLYAARTALTNADRLGLGTPVEL